MRSVSTLMERKNTIDKTQLIVLIFFYHDLECRQQNRSTKFGLMVSIKYWDISLIHVKTVLSSLQEGVSALTKMNKISFLTWLFS